MTDKNLNNTSKIIERYDPYFKFRWQIYDDLLKSSLTDNTTWLDLGCGPNSDIHQFEKQCYNAVGVDIYRDNNLSPSPFICADINFLPFADESFDFISLRFVVEHLDNPSICFNEIQRVLKPGGSILIMTTNLCSPIIFLPKILPQKLKLYLQKKIFKVTDSDIFPTFHKLNSKRKFQNISENLEIEKFEYIQDTNISSMWLFKIFFGWHLLTKKLKIQHLNSNIITVLRKTHAR